MMCFWYLLGQRENRDRDNLFIILIDVLQKAWPIGDFHLY